MYKQHNKLTPSSRPSRPRKQQQQQNKVTSKRSLTTTTTTKLKLSTPLRTNFASHRKLFSTTPPSPPQQRALAEEEEEEEQSLEIITRSKPSTDNNNNNTQISTPQPQHKSQTTSPAMTPKLPARLNSALPNDVVPPEGVVIFEHKARGWLQALPPIAAAVTVGMPTFAAIAAHATNYSPEIVTVFGCATASALFASYQAFKFTQSHVHLVRLKQDNLIEFETSGFFGYKKFVSYPANFIYPLIADPQHGMFGFKVRFLPLVQEMEREAGTLRSFDSGLVIAPDVNIKTGNPKTCWNHLISGSVAFSETEAAPGHNSRRRVSAMV